MFRSNSKTMPHMILQGSEKTNVVICRGLTHCKPQHVLAVKKKKSFRNQWEESQPDSKVLSMKEAVLR